MSADVLMFWKAGPNVKLSPSEIARELAWGEEVDGLIDLPVKDILDAIKNEFPRNDERPGLLICHEEAGSFEVTWTWQHLRVEIHDLEAPHRAQVKAVIEKFGCRTFEA
jgi:hypothetical protein